MKFTFIVALVLVNAVLLLVRTLVGEWSVMLGVATAFVAIMGLHAWAPSRLLAVMTASVGLCVGGVMTYYLLIVQGEVLGDLPLFPVSATATFAAFIALGIAMSLPTQRQIQCAYALPFEVAHAMNEKDTVALCGIGTMTLNSVILYLS